jgi:hypothetical protein
MLTDARVVICDIGLQFGEKRCESFRSGRQMMLRMQSEETWMLGCLVHVRRQLAH